ncbi:uncharacterized protein LOC106658195 isoform X2 [Trichogramma pretiosum]|uniref:uncharacterized protein LOC106658195 isoform X2 n=1 Tax=Trichogramma pretiosum TaxID=7493 RepID=UPI0006C9CDC3|nr:uncharacterized protein LOC106658195 isoform X2 [Trichogramma pretiosum]
MEIYSKNNIEDQQKLNGDSYLHKDITTFSSNQERVDLTRTDNIIDTMFQTVAAVPADILNKFSFINDKSSSETDDFYGFETSEYKQYDISKTTLKRLIEQEEADIFQISKRRKTTTLWKGLKNADSFSEEIDENISEPGSPKTVPEANFSDSTANDFSSKSEKCNNTSMNSTKTRTKRSFRAASPITTSRQKVSIDITNPLYREPFKYGWKRELVYRAGSSDNQSKRMADIYYYTPEGKKVRSFREVTETLTTSELTIENFTFFKEPLGVNDPAKEIIRDAKKGKEAHVPTKPYQKIPKKSIDTPPIQNDTPKKSSVKSTPPVIPVKTPSRNAKVASKLKVKISSKKVTPSKESKSPMTSTDNTVDTKVAQTSQWTNASNNKEIVDKNHAMKSKKIIKKKSNQIEADNKQHFMVSVCAGYHALSRIFQYLKVQELLRAGRVCRMWRDLAAHPSLWKTVRMKNSQVTDWDGFAEALKSRGTQYLDLRKMLIAGDAADSVWQKFVNIIPKITSLLKLELCRCPAMVVEEVMKNCPQLKILNALSIKCELINIECVSELKNCTELRLKGLNAMTLDGDLSSLVNLTQLTHLSLTSIKELGSKKITMVESLYNLESLELGECCDFPSDFGTSVLVKLQSLNRLRLEKGQGSCCTFDILEGISQLKNLTQLELVNFDVKNGFDRHLANCKNIKRFLIIPTYVSQSATSNNMILKGVTELSNNLTHFVWGVTQELLKVTELFVDQCNQMSKHVSGDSIPVLKPVPYMNLIQDLVNDKNQLKEEQQLNSSNPQVEILPLPHLQKLLLTALPKTRVKILKIPFHATWRQSITDSTTQ